MAASLVHTSRTTSQHDESFADLVLDYDDPDLRDDRSKSTTTSSDSEVSSFHLDSIASSSIPSVESTTRHRDVDGCGEDSKEADEDNFGLTDFEAMEKELIQSFPSSPSFCIEQQLTLRSQSPKPNSNSSSDSGIDSRFLPFDAQVLEQVLQMDNAQQVLEQVLNIANDPNFEPLPSPVLDVTLAQAQTRSIAATNSCDRCKSDLNQNLLVSCCTCSFRRHLYCFSPPLAHHPATTESANNPLAKRRWRCDSCSRVESKPPDPESEQDPGESQDLVSGGSNASKIPPMARQVSKAPRLKRKKSNRSYTNLEKQLHQKRLTALLHAKASLSQQITQFTVPIAQRVSDSQTPWPNCPKPDKELVQRVRRNQQQQAQEFDWKDFRAQKLEQMVQQKQQNLVLYSETEALMRKTASFWQWYIKRRRRHREQIVSNQLKRKPPNTSQFALMYLVTPEDLIKLDRTMMREEDEREVARRLYDDSYYNERRKALIAIEVLRLASLKAARAKAAAEAAEREKLRWHTETNRMLAEDPVQQDFLMYGELDLMRQEDTWKEIERILLGFYTAAKLIQNVFRRHQSARKRIQARCKRKARHGILFWRCNTKFRVLGMRARQRVKARELEQRMLVNLQRSLELQKESESIVDEDEKKRFVARQRIQRFFCGRVRRICRLKKTMFVVRIQSCWRRFANDRKWRQLAKSYRQWIRDTSARKIQHVYRRILVKRNFQMLQEKHALNHLRKRLRGWLMARAIKKEKRRRALLAQAKVLASQMTSNEWRFGIVFDQDDTLQVKDILHELGLGFYGYGDFYHAAVFLERSKSHGRVLSVEDLIVLGYCQCMNWHHSYDKFCLLQARDCYALALELAPEISKEGVIVLEMATVLMHLQEFKLSLRLLGKLIELFIHEGGDFLCNCLLLAAIQLKQVGEVAKSLEYLTFLIEQAPVAEYSESDLLIMCAVTSEEAYDELRAEDAWKAAVRLWKLHKKEERMENGLVNAAKTDGSWAHTTSKTQHQLMVSELAIRAKTQGHYLLATHLLTFALNNADPDRVDDNFIKWMELADIMRHQDNKSLCMNALSNAKQLKPDDPSVAQALEQWANPVHDFRTELRRVKDLERVRDIVNRNAEEMARQQELEQEQLAQQLAEQQAQQAADEATWSYETPLQDYWEGQEPDGDGDAYLQGQEQVFDPQQNQQWNLQEFNAEEFDANSAMYTTEYPNLNSSWT